MTDRLRLLATGVAVTAALGLAGCSSSSHHDSAAATRPVASTSNAVQPSTDQADTSRPPNGKPAAGTCPLSGLPPEAADTVGLIHSGGPFPHPRNDGVVFQNRERKLPTKSNGYYHEYTVDTPGAPTRGTRRVITGGMPLKAPPIYYYTGDHYKSFCTITGTD